MKADWVGMQIDNTYTPEFSTISKENYKKVHPFNNGTSFVLRRLIKENLPTDFNHMKNELIYKIKNVYKKFLLDNKDITIEISVNSSFSDAISINYLNVPNEILSRKIHSNEKIPTSKILVYKNKRGEFIPIVKHNNIHYKIHFKDNNNRRSRQGNISIKDMRGADNGAERVNIDAYSNKSEYKKLDVMHLTSRCTYHLCKAWCMNSETMIHPNGCINLIRKNRTLSDKCTALHYRNDSYGEYMYHELLYTSRLMDTPLGVQFNKNTDNSFNLKN